uniref:Putative ATP synthase subunit f n=1 Tax=Sipha flava TaxID=143950 RepID=A0A2S2QQ35_9HEMI
MAIGDYPAEYKPKVHGLYDPARFYGTPDTPFSQVKLGEMTQWIGRLNKSPSALAGLFSRAYWRWSHKYVQPKRATVAPLIHIITGSMLFFYTINYGKIIRGRNYKHH